MTRLSRTRLTRGLADRSNDMLKKKGWWALEVLVPLKSPTKDAGGIWITKTRPNLGRHRVVRDERPTVHYSVLLRQAEYGVFPFI